MHLQEILKAVVLIKPSQRKDPAEARPQPMDAAAPLRVQKAAALLLSRSLHIRQNDALHQIQFQFILQKRLEADAQPRGQPPHIKGIQNNRASHALAALGTPRAPAAVRLHHIPGPVEPSVGDLLHINFTFHRFSPCLFSYFMVHSLSEVSQD